MSKRARKEKTVTFKLVHPSYEDVEYDETPSVMVPAEDVERHQRKAGEDEPTSVAALLGFGAAEEDYTSRRNMLEMDNKEEADVELFRGAVECEFGDDFIQQMMYGDPKTVGKKSKSAKVASGENGGEGEEGDDEEDWDDDEEDWDDDDDDYYGEDGGYDEEEGEDNDGVEYPKHDVTSRAIDRQFTRMMQEFEMDAELNDPDVTDPRACGPLGVDQYLLALEEFVEENAGVDHAWEQPAKNRGLINQLKYMVHSAGAFDVDEGGVYMTTQLPEKQTRLMEEYRKRAENIRAEARKRVLQEQAKKLAAGAGATATTEGAAQSAVGEAAEEDGDEEEKEEEEEAYRIVEVVPKERYDCETIVSTYSTIYNHPNVIAASSKRVDISARAQRRKTKELAAQRSKAARQEREAAAAAEEDAREERREMLDMLSVRPKDESKDEKQTRRKAVKQAQREKRQQKKQVKEVYHNLSSVHAESAKKSRSMKAQLPLSLVRGDTV